MHAQHQERDETLRRRSQKEATVELSEELYGTKHTLLKRCQHKSVGKTHQDNLYDNDKQYSDFGEKPPTVYVFNFAFEQRFPIVLLVRCLLPLLKHLNVK